MAATLADCTIVVVTWRNAAEVPALLASLGPALADGAELCVVDNASGDDTVEVVRRLVPQARVIANASNVGFGAGANGGAAASTRPYVLFLNPDVVVESDVNILDIAALTVIVEEAGGRFTDLDGGAVGLGTTTVLASNGALHDTVLAALR